MRRDCAQARTTKQASRTRTRGPGKRTCAERREPRSDQLPSGGRCSGPAKKPPLGAAGVLRDGPRSVQTTTEETGSQLVSARFRRRSEPGMICSIPTSSRTSRRSAVSADSPKSTNPPGIPSLPLPGSTARRTNRTRRSRSRMKAPTATVGLNQFAMNGRRTLRDTLRARLRPSRFLPNVSSSTSMHTGPL